MKKLMISLLSAGLVLTLSSGVQANIVDSANCTETLLETPAQQLAMIDLETLIKYAEEGDAGTQAMLGGLYLVGKNGVPKNPSEGVKWLSKAAAQNHAVAQSMLGTCYECGVGVEANIQEALRLYRLSAEQGYSGAMYSLGYCYERGLGVAKSKADAALWYHQALQKGNNKALEALQRLGEE